MHYIWYLAFVLTLCTDNLALLDSDWILNLLNCHHLNSLNLIIFEMSSSIERGNSPLWILPLVWCNERPALYVLCEC